MPVGEWDAAGQYASVVAAVEGAAADDGAVAQVFQAQLDHTRLVYYIVAVDKHNARLVGVKADAVES